MKPEIELSKSKGRGTSELRSRESIARVAKGREQGDEGDEGMKGMKRAKRTKGMKGKTENR